MYYILGHHIDVFPMHYNLKPCYCTDIILFSCRLLRTRMTLMLRGGTESQLTQSLERMWKDINISWKSWLSSYRRKLKNWRCVYIMKILIIYRRRVRGLHLYCLATTEGQKPQTTKETTHKYSGRLAATCTVVFWWSLALLQDKCNPL